MQFLSEKFDNRTRLLALFLAWTLCLTLTTLSVQHSDNPFICVSPACKVAPNPPPAPPNPPKTDKFICVSPACKVAPNPPPAPPNPPKTDKCNKNGIPLILGVGSGVAAGGTVAAL